jgi:hypothetical protein
MDWMVKFCIVIFIVFFGCNPKEGQNHLRKSSPMSPLNYSERIIQTSEKVQDLTWQFEPLTYSEFGQIYMNPEIYLDSALLFLSNYDFDTVEFGVVVLSMHKLPIDEYVTFASYNFELLKRKLITVDQFISVINGFYGNDCLIKNKESKIVREFYMEILSDKQSPKKLIEYIKEIN